MPKAKRRAATDHQTDKLRQTWERNQSRKPNSAPWQPIETAPADGTYLLVYSDYDVPWKGDGEENPHIAQHYEGRWRIQLDGQTIQPTHWMRLPDPPRR